MDPQNHEHPEGFPEHIHPHAETYHMNFDGISGGGKDTGHAVLDVPGAESAIIGDHPHPAIPAGVVSEGGAQASGPPRLGTLTLEPFEIDIVEKAINGALCFHETRDQMNAALHEQDVRWSPLTLSLKAAFGTFVGRQKTG